MNAGEGTYVRHVHVLVWDLLPLMKHILGSEYGIVLLSTVRSRHVSQDSGDTADIGWIRKNLGFVTDPHRICVGITRSKYGLVIVGEQIDFLFTR